MNRYRLNYGDGSSEYVDAASATDAVVARTYTPRYVLPHTITDETAVAAWARNLRYRADEPLVRRIYDPADGWDER